MSFKYRFSFEQLSAIQAPLDQHTVVSGVPGTGKTTVLIERVDYLVATKKIDPQKIWIIAPSSRTIGLIKNKLSQKNISAPDNISKFDNLCWSILKKDINLLKKDDFQIISEYSERILVENIFMRYSSCTDQKPFHKEITELMQLISLVKFKIFPETFISEEEYHKVCEMIYAQSWMYMSFSAFHKFFSDYLDYMKKKNWFNLDDVLLYANKLLDDEKVSDYWHNQVDALLIDEFQNLNSVQLEVIKKVLKDKKHLFAISNWDQKVFDLTGTQSKILSDFLNSYSNVKTVKLAQNYRSTKKILKASNFLIDRNLPDVPTDKDKGSKIKCFHAPTYQEEIKWVIKEIRTLIKKENALLGDFLILYRNYDSSKGLKKELTAQNMNYCVVGSEKFLKKKAIQLIISYLNLIFFDDSISVEQILIATSGIGPQTIWSLKHQAKNSSQELFNVVKNIQNIGFLSKHKQSLIQKLFSQIEQIRQLECKDFGFVVKKIMEIIGYRDELLNKQKLKKVKNIDFFISEVTKYLNHHPDITFKDFVLHLPLHVRSIKEESCVDAIHLSSIHNSLGLEYKYVFVIHMMENILPSYQSIFKKEITAERKMAYIAFTRAQNKLFLSSSKNFEFGISSNYEESRFIKEIKESGEIEGI